MVNLCRVLAITFLVVATLLLSSSNARGQVTTATLYGIVHDTSGANLPGVSNGATRDREPISAPGVRPPACGPDDCDVVQLALSATRTGQIGLRLMF